MTEPDGAAEAVAPSITAGAVLRTTRERAGLSIDAVAQQLKLAPRQVEALELDDYARLPGRTFVRGFLRNYARLLGLDSASLLELLPDAEHPATLERPALQPTPRAIGELPSEAPARRTWSRIAIPLALIAIVGVAAVYEFTRQQSESRRAAEAPAKGPTAGSAIVTLQNPPVDAEKTTPSDAPAPSSTTPVATTTESAPAPAPAAAAPTATPTSNAASPSPTVTPIAPTAPTASPAAAPPPAETAVATAVPPPDAASVVFSFRGTSWVEVKDRRGAVVLAVTGTRGTTQTANGSPPLEIIVGNAPEVGVMFHGEPVDLSRYTRQNVARVTLK